MFIMESENTMANDIDPRTGRPFGDHGTASQAIEWALDHEADEPIAFLIDWREGSTYEYPEFLDWLKEQEV